MKKIISFLVSCILIVTLLVACETEEKVNNKSQKQQIQQVKENKNQEKINVKIKIDANKNEGRPYFIVETNLPDNTEGLVVLVNEKTDYIESSNIKIINGRAKTKEFSGENKKLKPGVYEIIFTVSAYQNQPGDIQEKLGKNYKNVVGKYLNKSDLGTDITCKQNITIK